MKIFTEAIVIGILLLIIFCILHCAYMVYDTESSMSHFGIFSTVFSAGALTHLICEYSGLNDKYCQQRAK